MGNARNFESDSPGERQSKQSTAERVRENFGVRLWPGLTRIYDLIDLGISRILIRSCNGAGKSTLLASIIVDQMMQHEDISVVCTAASATQMKETLWRATKRFAKNSKLDISSFRADGWEPSASRRVVPIAPSKVESAQGYHAARVVIIIDEATGTSTDKITALLSNATNANCLCIFTYNPINPDAAVFSLEESAIPVETLLDEDGDISVSAVAEVASTSAWVSIGISAFDHPNVIEGHELIVGAVTRQYIESVLAIESLPCDVHYPEAIILPWTNKAFMPTPEAQARICGKWATTQSSGFISGQVIVDSWKVEARSGLRVAGADIGGGGDDPSVWTHFEGNNQIGFQTIKTGELGTVASMIHDYCITHQIEVLGIDDTGVGHGVTDRLQDLKPSYKIIPINFGSAPKMFREIAVRKPANARCEMYLLLEKEMRSKQLRILYDKDLQRELSCMRIVSFKQSDSIKIEDKALIKRRIGRSPDKADATAIARYASRLLAYYNQPMMY